MTHHSSDLWRKKPVTIAARQWFANGHCPVWAQHAVTEYGGYFAVKTLEGLMKGEPGDWIIRGVKGEIYSCKPDIFAETYERADSHPPQPSGWRDIAPKGWKAVTKQALEVLETIVQTADGRNCCGNLILDENSPIMGAARDVLQAAASVGTLRDGEQDSDRIAFETWARRDMPRLSLRYNERLDGYMATETQLAYIAFCSARGPTAHPAEQQEGGDAAMREALRWSAAALLHYVTTADDEHGTITLLEDGRKKRLKDILDMADAAMTGGNNG